MINQLETNKYYLVDIMGLIQSISAATKASNVAPTPVADTSSNTVESQSSTEPVKAVELVKEQTTESTIVKETVEEVKPVEVKPEEVKPEEVKAVEVKPVEVKPEEVKPEEVKPEEVKAVEVKPVEVKPVEVKPVEVKPEEVKPEEVKPVEAKPVEVKAVEVKPEEVKAEEVKPVEDVPQTPNSSPTVTVADNTSSSERYVIPSGTKVEVAPVEVTPLADVVKKNKNKHKKKNNS